jgi:hypothetical protein
MIGVGDAENLMRHSVHPHNEIVNIFFIQMIMHYIRITKTHTVLNAQR